VYVIGAGASKEANLPIGNELKTDISSLLDFHFDDFGRHLRKGDKKILDALQYHVTKDDGSYDMRLLLQEALHTSTALPLAISIDNFIDAHKQNENIAICGKLGIIRSILMAEKKSLLNIKDSTIDLNLISKTWYISFFQLLTENCNKEDLAERFKYITLIIFNYDRCIEHFLFHALKIYYQVNETEAAQLIKNINIYHPYGSVGDLPWMNGNDAIEFGSDPHPKKILELSKQIKTFTEGTNPDSSEISFIRGHMARANKLIFIGFAFHKLNMKLIEISEHNNYENNQLECFATTFGISSNDVGIIRSQIIDLYGRKIKTSTLDAECSDFFKEYWRSLSF
jgi:hypothetical protein